MNSGSFKNVINKMCLEIIYFIYKHKMYLELNDLQWLICYKSKLNQTKLSSLSLSLSIYIYIYIYLADVSFLSYSVRIQISNISLMSKKIMKSMYDDVLLIFERTF